ncbi:MAG: NlpC/P60 family protein [Pricia sp.]
MYLHSTVTIAPGLSSRYYPITASEKTRIPVKGFLLFLLIFWGASNLSYSQEPTLIGTVVEEDSSTKIANAIVAVEGTAFAEATDDTGEFRFKQSLPAGEHVVTVSKTGFEKVYFLINTVEGKKLVVDEVEMTMTKKEKKRRKKAKKERKSKIKEAAKEDEQEDKELAKEEKKLKKGNKGLLGIFKKDKEPDVTVTYEDVPEKEEEQPVAAAEPEEIITPMQRKYADILGVAPEEITNLALYDFIDNWMGTPYLMGGETEAGIDCSSFAQRLFIEVYDWYIERTAQKQMDSEATETWSDPKFLMEGDFVFFRAAGHIGKKITHVGIYLGNNKFVNATSRTGESGSAGVKISDLLDPYWKTRFFAGGRRINTNG